MVVYFVPGSVSMSQVDEAFNVLYYLMVLTDVAVSFSFITFSFDLFIFRPRVSFLSAMLAVC